MMLIHNRSVHDYGTHAADPYTMLIHRSIHDAGTTDPYKMLSPGSEERGGGIEVCGAGVGGDSEKREGGGH
jgi:hypothetical protein